MDRFTESDLAPIIPHLRRYALGLTGDGARADDLVQDCLERALCNAHRFKHGTNLKAWLFTILHNSFCSDVRRWKSRGIHVDIDNAAGAMVTQADQEASLASSDVWACLQRLNAREREVLMLVSVEGLSYEEASRAMGVELGTVKSRLFRAREKFRTIYGEMTRPRKVAVPKAA